MKEFLSSPIFEKLSEMNLANRRNASKGGRLYPFRILQWKNIKMTHIIMVEWRKKWWYLMVFSHRNHFENKCYSGNKNKSYDSFWFSIDVTWTKQQKWNSIIARKWNTSNLSNCKKKLNYDYFYRFEFNFKYDSPLFVW